MNKKIKIGLFALIILGTITLCLTYKSNDKIIKTKKRKQNNLAIMIKEDGATDYTKSNSKDIPKGDYVLNRDKSYCKNNGKIGDYDSSLGKVSFSFIGSDSCYLYFDYKAGGLLYETIEKKYNQDTSKTYLDLYTGEESDTYANPVYYYKDNVENNNVLFAGFCWKIVRTTETGGVKIVYNGVQKDGSCNNTGTDSQIGTSAFNNDYNSPAYVGYMYNTVYPTSSKSMSSQSNIVFGNSFNYNSNNGTYTLTNTKTVATWSSGYNTINNNHYTCMTTGTTCTSLYYVYYTNSTDAYYITLTNGKSVNDALNEMLYANDVNTNDSTIKNYIDKWYINNLKSFEDKLEDTIFCNDRKISDLGGWNPNGGSITSNAITFNVDGGTSLKCENKNDRFTVESTNGNGALIYPVGLLTQSEMILANFGSSSYLNNKQNILLITPALFSVQKNISDTYVGCSSVGCSSSGFCTVKRSFSVRPVISLKPNTYFSSGDGSFTNPFVIGDAVEEPSEKSFDTVFAANNIDIFNENGLRYEGADPNNYICLDNKTSGACSSSSLLFRIIGLFDEDTSSDGTSSSGTKKLLKVIDTNNYGGTSGKYWNSAGTNNWSSASLKTELNGAYLNTLLVTPNVNDKLSSAIANAKWHLGGANANSESGDSYYYKSITTENVYKAERPPYHTFTNLSENIFQNLYSGNPSSIYAKVGLMYPSDYGYATVGGSTANKSSCRAKELLNWDSSSHSDCKNNDWLFTSQNNFVNIREWLLSPYSSDSLNAAGLYSSGFVNLYGYGVSDVQFAVRPTFYLDSSILKIVGGTGTSDNAYRIG